MVRIKNERSSRALTPVWSRASWKNISGSVGSRCLACLWVKIVSPLVLKAIRKNISWKIRDGPDSGWFENLFLKKWIYISKTSHMNPDYSIISANFLFKNYWLIKIMILFITFKWSCLRVWLLYLSFIIERADLINILDILGCICIKVFRSLNFFIFLYMSRSWITLYVFEWRIRWDWGGESSSSSCFTKTLILISSFLWYSNKFDIIKFYIRIWSLKLISKISSWLRISHPSWKIWWG